MPAATKWIEACNTALVYIGGRLIQTLNEPSVEAQSCNLFLNQTRREILSAYPWNAATRRESLALIGEAGKNGNPAWPYRYAFALPADCLRVLRLENGLPTGSLATIAARPLPYEVSGITVKEKSCAEQTVLLCDVFQPLLVYICTLDNPDLWPPKLMEALINRLAERLALSVAENEKRERMFAQNYLLSLQEAMLLDAREGHDYIPPDDTYLRERAGGHAPDPITDNPEDWRRKQ
jgi:hypothetical protein